MVLDPSPPPLDEIRSNETWEWVRARIEISRGARMQKTCYTGHFPKAFEWDLIKWDIGMSHGTHRNESWHTYEWVMSNEIRSVLCVLCMCIATHCEFKTLLEWRVVEKRSNLSSFLTCLLGGFECILGRFLCLSIENSREIWLLTMSTCCSPTKCWLILLLYWF